MSVRTNTSVIVRYRGQLGEIPTTSHLLPQNCEAVEHHRPICFPADIQSLTLLKSTQQTCPYVDVPHNPTYRYLNMGIPLYAVDHFKCKKQISA